MALSHSPSIVTNGLVLCLDAANRRSYPGTGTTWTDLSGNRNNGTLTNGPTFSAVNGGSIVFDGVDDYARTISLPLTGNETALTISCWFKPQNVNTIKSIISIGDESGGARRMLLQRNAKIEANGYNNDYTSSNDLLIINLWCNVAIVYSSLTLSTGIKLFFNGVQISGYVALGSTLTSFINKTLTICGNNASPPTENAQCSISNVYVYNRALTANEVRQNYNATRGRFL